MTSPLLTAVAIPLDIPPKNCYMAFNFENNYGLPSNNSYNEWIDRWDLDTHFLGVGSGVTPIDGRNNGDQSQGMSRRSVGSSDGPPTIRRYDFYRSIINYMVHYGFNGSACLLRTICEVSEKPLDAHNGVLGSIIQILFMPTTSAPELHLQHVDSLYEATDRGTRGLGCSDYVANCEHSMLDMISIML
ncbi:uncharacterized protein Dwil_GK16780 [Drosophila willistoni]|uniref:Uncharacterized protein n=1 Tax=Drosophila willistoni TaxID=7260 RepID=B4MLZ4_DROWI|nr:uncharacterized protein Dwil_GK16780 [Drosophila willistoni]